MSNSSQFHVLLAYRLPCALLSPWVCSNSHPLSWLSKHLILCHPLLLLPSFFPKFRVFSSESALPIRADQSTGASASASVLPMNIQGSFPLGLTGLISLLSKGLSRVFSKTTFRNHQFFNDQPSLCSNSHIHT